MKLKPNRKACTSLEKIWDYSIMRLGTIRQKGKNSNEKMANILLINYFQSNVNYYKAIEKLQHVYDQIRSNRKVLRPVII